MSESNRLLNFATSSELIANGEGRNVLSAIEDGLRNCDEFLISVAFITPEGLLTLKPILKELEESGILGLKPIAMIHMHVRLRKSLIYIGIPSLPFPMKSLFLGIGLDGYDQIILHKRILLNSLEK